MAGSSANRLINSLIAPSSPETSSSILNKLTYWRAFDVLDGQDPIVRQGINWRSEDDPFFRVKQKAITYQSEQGSFKLLLTDFHHKIPCDRVDGTISVEIYLGENPLPERNAWSFGKGEVLFTLTRDGELTSPLQLVDPESASSIISLFVEDQAQD